MTLSARQLAEIAQRIGGNQNSSILPSPETSISHILTDSRTPLANATETCFFALTTETDDGRRYIPELYAKGVRNFVLAPGFEFELPDANLILCSSPEELLAKSAAEIRSHVDCRIVGVTGSYGKTPFKEMLAAALIPAMPTVRSPRSWNSQIGLPMSLWLLEADTHVGIFEAGVSRPGEMQRLKQMMQPNIGVFTGLGRAHDEGFISLREKAREKAQLFTDCSLIFYPAEQTIIAETLAKILPDEALRPIEGGLEAIALAVATELGADPKQAAELIARNDNVSGRIDLTEIPPASSVAFDHCSCDLPSIATALDFLCRRIPGGRHLSAYIGKLQYYPADLDKTFAELSKQLAAAQVGTIFTDAEEFFRHKELFEASRINIRRADELPAQLEPDTVLYINTPDKTASMALRDRLCALRHITRMNIDLEALVGNFKYYKSLLPPETRTIAMIKASAYGCGAVEVARSLQAAGADCFAVAVVDEGAALREAAVKSPIIVLDPWCTDPRAIAANRLEPTLIAPNEEMLRSLSEAAEQAGIDSFPVHVKLDTGMHRLGLNPEQIEPFAQMLARYPKLRPVSCFSHLATADCLDQDGYTQSQLDLFDSMSQKLDEALSRSYGKEVKLLRHILNTAGVQRFAAQGIHGHAVRLGIGLYGISPLQPTTELRPVASLTTTVIAVSSYPEGATVGYGRRGVLKRSSIIATLPIGYADGINRHLGCGAASFLVDGHPCPTVGNICMDLCMIDITDCPTAVRPGTQVEIFGNNAPIERLAEVLGTIPYEILTAVSPRVRRVYFRG